MTFNCLCGYIRYNGLYERYIDFNEGRRDYIYIEQWIEQFNNKLIEIVFSEFIISFILQMDCKSVGYVCHTS